MYELAVVLPSGTRGVGTKGRRFTRRNFRFKTPRFHFRGMHRRQMLRHDIQRILQVSFSTRSSQQVQHLFPKPASQQQFILNPGFPLDFFSTYSLSLFDHFCPVKWNGEYFTEKWSEQKVLIIKVVGLYSTYQKYKRIGVPSSYQFGENWT